jgi:tRNA pseudouridine55 synthase
MFAMKENGLDQVVVDGVLNVNKPSAWTSHDVVAKLRGVLRGHRVGHAGTLDPAATGVLPVLVGRATRIAEYLLEWDKNYRAVLRLGQTTDTLDATGTVLSECVTDGLTNAALQSAFALFHGDIHQVPPMYSAVKVGGVPLYKAARAGKTIEREVRRVTIHDLQILTIDGRDVTFQVRCSKGTYVRTLCADIGEALGVGGHLLALERRRVGPLHIERSCTIDQALDAIRTGHVHQFLTLDEALAHLPALMVRQVAAERTQHGVPIPLHAVQWDRVSDRGASLGGRTVRIQDPSGRLLAVGSVPRDASRPDGVVTIVKVFVEIGQSAIETIS